MEWISFSIFSARLFQRTTRIVKRERVSARRQSRPPAWAVLSKEKVMITRILSGLVTAFFFLTAFAVAADPVLKPKVVVVTMFEPGADTGDTPGELQFWVEREHLDRVIPLPAAFHAVRANADGSVIAILTGVGNTNAAASVMALGLDPRFDLRQSYWVVAGIAGIDPADGSLASAVWTDFVVDGDLKHEIDAREIPADWTTGIFPLDKARPYEKPRPTEEYASAVFELDRGLVRWAYELTRDTPLIENEVMIRRRAKYADKPNAQRPPFVLVGANLAGSTYWSGKLLNQWANAWVAYQTDNRANYVTTAMEDSGTLRALKNLDRAGKVDARRTLVLRTASDFDMQWPGGTALEGLRGDKDGQYPAFVPSLEAAYRVGSRVVHELVNGWEKYATTLPVPPAK
jgi:purine nucleoside permease